MGCGISHGKEKDPERPLPETTHPVASSDNEGVSDALTVVTQSGERMEIVPEGPQLDAPSPASSDSSAAAAGRTRYHVALRSTQKKQFTSVLVSSEKSNGTIQSHASPSTRRGSRSLTIDAEWLQSATDAAASATARHSTATTRPPPLIHNHNDLSGSDHRPPLEGEDAFDASYIPPCMSATTVAYMSSARFTQRSGSIAASTSALSQQANISVDSHPQAIMSDASHTEAADK